MSLTSISATLTPDDGQSPVEDHRDAVIEAVTIIKAKLPFLVDLTLEERKAKKEKPQQAAM